MGADFLASLALIVDLAGLAIDAGQPCTPSSDKRTDGIELAERWTRRYRPWRGSQAAEYSCISVPSPGWSSSQPLRAISFVKVLMEASGPSTRMTPAA